MASKTDVVMFVATKSFEPKDPAVIVVATRLVIVALVEFNLPELTLVEASNVEVVMLLVARRSPVISNV